MAVRASYDFTGRTVVVTGGLIGIGAAIADAFRHAGARVAIWDLGAEPDAEKVLFRVDVSDPVAVAQAAQETRNAFGGIDILINNAGFAGPTLPLEDYDPAVWRRIIDVNLNGAFHVTQALLPALKKGGWGRVVNIASLAGKEGTANSAAYSASKAGMIALTKSLGKELAGTGVLVNAIAPAAVHTTLLDQMSPEHVATMLAKSPMRRAGEPEEVAAMVLWLSSDSCSFNTGAVFDLSGGRATY